MNKTYCFFSARYLPYLGGVERYTYNLAKELIALGNNVIVITSLIGSEPAYEESERIKIYRLPSFRLLDGRFPVAKNNKNTKKTFQAINENPIDYVVINTRFYLLSYWGALFARKNHIPSIVIEHGTGHFTINNKVFDCVGHVYEHFISFLMKRNCSQYYGVSFECNKWLTHFHITAKGVLYNAVDTGQIINLSQVKCRELENPIEYNEKDVIITFTGRLIKEKGILKLIVAFKEIKKKFPNTKLCIAGDGDLYDTLSHERYDDIYLLGKLPFDKVIALLNLTTIFCLPTDYPEGLPTSILEAVCCRNYIITTKSGGAKEIITDSSYGIIMDKNDTDEIQKIIIDALKNEQKRKNAVEKAYNKVIHEFTWSTTAKQLTEIFE